MLTEKSKRSCVRGNSLVQIHSKHSWKLPMVWQYFIVLKEFAEVNLWLCCFTKAPSAAQYFFYCVLEGNCWTRLVPQSCFPRLSGHKTWHSFNCHTCHWRLIFTTTDAFSVKEADLSRMGKHLRAWRHCFHRHNLNLFLWGKKAEQDGWNQQTMETFQKCKDQQGKLC